MQNTICWVEIPVRDFDRAQKFYETVLETSIQSLTLPFGRYGMFPHAEQAPNAGGALVETPDHQPHPGGSVIYLDGGADLSVALSRVEAAGGSILMPKTDNSGFGYIAHFKDSEGNRMGLYSPQ